MTTQTRNPTSDEAVAGTWSGSAGTRYQAVDDHPDSAGADFLAHGTTAGNLTFGFAAFNVPAGSTGLSIDVLYYDAEPANGNNNSAARLKVGGNYYNSATHNPAGATYTLRTKSWATNPKSGVAWTVDDVNGVGVNALEAFGLYSTDANPVYRVASVLLQVTYTEPPPPISGTGAVTSVKVAPAASAKETFKGASALTDRPAVLGATAAQRFSGASAVNSARVALASTGAVSAPSGFTGTGALAAVMAQLAGSGAQRFAGVTSLTARASQRAASGASSPGGGGGSMDAALRVTVAKYASPDLIPAGLRHVALITAGNSYLQRVNAREAVPVPNGEVVYGVVEYASADEAPAHMLRITQ
ncbi:MAG: hypothetical protein WC718_16425 [Phycisphaerales bacterium]|jgi:hypothetical protein